MTEPRRHTLEDYLVRLRLPEALLSAENLERIRPFARLLPPTDGFGFESRLAEALPAADFSVYFSQLARRQNPLVDRIPSRTARSPVWKKTRELFAAWANPESAFSSTVTSLWLELDLPAAGPAPTTPNLFLGMAAGVRAEDDLAWLFEDVVPMLAGRPLPRSVGSAVRRSIRELPAGGRVFQVGFMLARRSTDLRLCLEEVAPADMVGYLQRAGWCGDARGLAEELARLGPLTDRLILALAIGDGVAERIGLECYAGTTGWAPLLDHFVDRGLCLDGKREALLSFPETLAGTESAPLYPEEIARLSTRLGLWERRSVRFLINHLKLTLGDGLPPEAKAYYGVRYLWQENGPAVQKNGITTPGIR